MPTTKAVGDGFGNNSNYDIALAYLMTCGFFLLTAFVLIFTRYARPKKRC